MKNRLFFLLLLSMLWGCKKDTPTNVTSIQGVLGSGVNLPYNTTNYLYTGATITLPPGKYFVYVVMLITPTTYDSPDNSSFWFNTSFYDSPTATSRSNDVLDPYFVSGNLPGSSKYSLVTGGVVINNTSNASKTYYYFAGNVTAINTTETLNMFGAPWGSENGIVATPVQ